MVIKNLAAHRMRNKQTSIIYSISLGFIIFLVVSYNLQISAIALQELQGVGGYLAFETSGDWSLITPDTFDIGLKEAEHLIENFAFISWPISEVKWTGVDETILSDNAKINTITNQIIGVQPSIFDAALDDFLVTDFTTGSALSLGE